MMRAMSLYAVHYTYSDDTEARDEHRQAHRSFLSGLAQEGVVLLSGPYPRNEEVLDGTPDGALLLVRGSSVAQLSDLFREDPFQQQGLVEQVVIREWQPVLGEWFTPELAQ